VTKIETRPNGIVATVENDKSTLQTIEAERMISAIGIAGNVENLGLENLGVKNDHGIISTDGVGRANVPGLYAIGDAAGPPMLAHKASHTRGRNFR
jgi:dihydrolipoamide dehydrogenase